MYQIQEKLIFDYKPINNYLKGAHGTDVWLHLKSQVSCLEKVIVKLLNHQHTYNSNSHDDDDVLHPYKLGYHIVKPELFVYTKTVL